MLRVCGIETERRLVEEQHLRVMQDAPSDLEPPAHATRIREDRRARAVREVDDLQRVVDALLARRRRQAVEVGVELEVLATGELAVERGVLKDQPDPRANRAGILRTSKPATWATPDVGRMSVQRMLIVVDFPAPFGPRNPKISPALTSRSIPRTASTFP